MANSDTNSQTASSSIKVIAFDADDTLWRNEDIFNHAQDTFIEILSSYHNEHYIRSHLGAVQVRNLKYFGYGIKGFTLSMIESAIELTEGRITGAKIHQIIELARTMLSAPIELIDHVETVLSKLQGDYQLMVITKGDLLDQEGKVSRSGLVKYFDHIEVVSDKTPIAYQRILEKHKIDKQGFLMVGNSLKSDVLPVLDIGAQAIHVPYHCTWAHEQVLEKDLVKYPDLVTLETIDSLLSWLSHSDNLL
ncbi:dUMP phosphatase [Marinomonas spartinae]|uniref:HAD family hydrolase n=1 Tax=Marinomonas spartinae TaxID=1792290 RepID=UPI000808CB6E|nr:HAD family hydrolase [Marinomonas spartinae]SBS37935.1 dUMP phosphatase [Marinomonas spartinae]